MSSLSALPTELHVALSSYLEPLDRLSLSKSSQTLRHFYLQHAYSKCLLIPRDGNGHKPYPLTDSEYAIIPIRVILNPGKYSWFPASQVHKIICMDYCIPRLLDGSSSDYFTTYTALHTLEVRTSEKHLRDEYENSLFYAPLSPEMYKDFSYLIRLIPRVCLDIASNKMLEGLSYMPYLSNIRLLEISKGVTFNEKSVDIVAKLENLEELRIYSNDKRLAEISKYMYSQLSNLTKLTNIITVHLVTSSTMKTLEAIPAERFSNFKVVLIETPFNRQTFNLTQHLPGGRELDERYSAMVQDDLFNQFSIYTQPSAADLICPSITQLHVECKTASTDLLSTKFPSVNDLSIRRASKRINISHIIPNINPLNITSLSLSFFRYSGALATVHHLPIFKNLRKISIDPWSYEIESVMTKKVTTSAIYAQFHAVIRLLLHIVGDYFLDFLYQIDIAQPGNKVDPSYVCSGNEDTEISRRFIEALSAAGYHQAARSCGLERDQSVDLISDLINNPVLFLSNNEYLFEALVIDETPISNEDVLKSMKVLLAYIEITIKNLMTIPTLEYVDFAKIEGVMSSPRLRCMVESHPTIKQILTSNATKIMPYPDYTTLVQVPPQKDLMDEGTGIAQNCFVIDAEARRKNFKNFRKDDPLVDAHYFSNRLYYYSNNDSIWSSHNGWQNTRSAFAFHGWL